MPSFKKILMGSLSGTALIAGSTTAAFAQADTLHIGVIGPETGVFANFGERNRAGVELAHSQYGDSVAGLDIEVSYYDTEGDPEVTVNRLNAMQSRDDVDIVIGPVLGSTGVAANDWAGDSGMPMVISYSAPEDITMRDRNRNVVRAGWTGAQPMFAFGEFVAQELGHDTIAMVGQDYDFPHNQIGGFLKTFCQNGGKSVERIWHPVGESDFSSILATLPDADAVMYNGAGSDGVAFFEQYRDFGMLQRYPLTGGSNFFRVGALPEMGDDALGGYSALQYTGGLETEQFLEFANAYEDMHGQWPQAPDEHSYVAFNMIVQAVERAGGWERDAVIEELYNTDMPDAPRGPMYIDDYGNPVQNIYITEVQRKGGELRNVPVATIEEVSQFGPYDPESYLAGEPDSRNFPPGDCSASYYDEL